MNSTSAVGTLFVPSLFLSRRIVNVVPRPVLEMAGYEVQTEPGRALRRTVRPREQRDRLAVDVGAEPLLAVDPHAPVADVTRGAMHGAAQVGTTVSFGEEHRAIDPGFETVGAQPREQAVAHFGRRVRVHESGDATRHAHAANEPGIRLRHEVVRTGDDDAGRGPAPRAFVGCEARHIPALPHRALRIEHGRMVFDLVDLARPTVVAHELRGMRVHDVGVARDARSDELAQLGQLGVGPLDGLRADTPGGPAVGAPGRFGTS